MSKAEPVDEHVDEHDEVALADAAFLFHSLSDPSRLKILLHLQFGGHRVIDLVQHLDLSQSTVSQHLACLKEAGLVESHSQGRASVYSLTHEAEMKDILQAAENFLALDGKHVDLCPVHGRPGQE